MKRTKNGFDRLSDANLSKVIGVIVASMANNDYFTTLQSDVAELKTLNTDFIQLVSVAEHGTRLEVAVKNAKRKELIAKARANGNSVTAIADGNEEILASSSYPVTGTPTPAAPVSKPQNVKVAPGKQAGQIVMSLQKDYSALNYLYQYAVESDQPVWETVACNYTTCTISGLQTGVRYLVRIISAGRDMQQVIGDTYYVIPQ
jgi:hypothetical protein